MSDPPMMLDDDMAHAPRRWLLPWHATAVARRGLMLIAAAVACALLEWLVHGVRLYEGWRTVFWIQTALAASGATVALLALFSSMGTRRTGMLAVGTMLVAVILTAWAVFRGRIIVN